MSRKNFYRNVQASLIRFCRDFADEMTPHGFSLGFLNLDAHADDTTWPDGDFIGMGELNVDVMEQDEVMVSFAIATDNDSNLLRMSELINELANRLLPNSQIKVYDAETGAVVSSLFVTNGVRIGTPIRTKSQPLQPITLRLLSDHRNF